MDTQQNPLSDFLGFNPTGNSAPSNSPESGGFGSLLGSASSLLPYAGMATSLLSGLGVDLSFLSGGCGPSWYDEEDMTLETSEITEEYDKLVKRLNAANDANEAARLLQTLDGLLSVAHETYKAKLAEGWRSACTIERLENMVEWSRQMKATFKSDILPYIEVKYNMTRGDYSQTFDSDFLVNNVFSMGTRSAAHLRPMAKVQIDDYILEPKNALQQFGAGVSQGVTQLNSNSNGQTNTSLSWFERNQTVLKWFGLSSLLGGIIYKYFTNKN